MLSAGGAWCECALFLLHTFIAWAMAECTMTILIGIVKVHCNLEEICNFGLKSKYKISPRLPLLCILPGNSGNSHTPS